MPGVGDVSRHISRAPWRWLAVVAAVFFIGCAWRRRPFVPDPHPERHPFYEPPPKGVIYGGGDGSSCEEAVTLEGTWDGSIGVVTSGDYSWPSPVYNAESVWLAEHYALPRTMGEAARSYSFKARCSGFVADVHVLRRDGKKHRIIFDSTKFVPEGGWGNSPWAELEPSRATDVRRRPL